MLPMRRASSRRSNMRGRTEPMIEIQSTPLPDGGFVQTFTDVTKRSQAEAYIARLASEDPLTGLPNRRVFAFHHRPTKRRQYRGGDAAMAGAEFAVHVPRPRPVQGYQRHAWPSPRRHAAGRRRAAVEEFIAGRRRAWRAWAATNSPSCCHRSSPRNTLQQMASAIVDAVARPYEIEGHSIRSAVSIGIAIAPSNGKNADELLMAADLALYAVKNGGRGTYRFFKHSMNEEINDRRQIEVDLREALEQNNLISNINRLSTAEQRRFRLRSTRAVGASDRKADPAFRLYPHCRGQRTNPSARRMGAAGGLQASGKMAERHQACRQSVGRPVHSARPGRYHPARTR